MRFSVTKLILNNHSCVTEQTEVVADTVTNPFVELL